MTEDEFQQHLFRRRRRIWDRRCSPTARVILTSRYIKNATVAQGANLVNYMAKRAGAEIPNIIDLARPSTRNQQRLISQIFKAAPEVSERFEYEDYRASPTIVNALELIAGAFENNLALWGNVRNYVDYIGKHPGVERSQASGHGL